MNNVIIKTGILFFYIHFYITIAIAAIFKVVQSVLQTIRDQHVKRMSIDPYQNTNPLVFQNIDKIIEHDGFSIQKHRFQTGDGCQILMWRIFKKDSQFLKKYPVLLMHGLLDCSISWFLHTDKKKCLPYILASQGYDVWVGNNRGNRISLKEENQHNDHQHWNYTLDHLVEYDQPTIINGILKITNKEKIVYVGHSQGSTQFLLGLGVHLQLKEKIASFIGLGTVLSLNNVKSHFVLNILSKLYLLQFCKLINLNKILIIPLAISKKVGVLIDNSKLHFQILMGFIRLLCGFNNNNKIPQQLFGVIITHEPGGGSTNNALHWIQCYRYGGIIRKFCYGKNKNMQIYGNEQPPSYCLEHLKELKFNSYLFRGSKDSVISNEDFNTLLSHFGSQKVFSYDIHDYNHLDYIWSKSGHIDYYHTIMDIVQKTQDN